MNVIISKRENTLEVKRSKFITFIVSISEFDGMQDKLKLEHPKANHVTYALRYLNEFDQVVENSSDDGEPKGSAGIPMLNVMRGEELIDCAVLIVRYFGGIKLGRGGMARAYADATKMVIDPLDIKKYEKEYIYSFKSNHSNVRQIEYLLLEVGVTYVHKEFGTDNPTWEIKASRSKIDDFKSRAGRIIRGIV